MNEAGGPDRVITNRLFIKYFHEQAVQQTIRWLDAHGIPYWDLWLLPDKAAVGADLYVDDTPAKGPLRRALLSPDRGGRKIVCPDTSLVSPDRASAIRRS